MQLLDWTANKSSAVGRLLLLSGLGGVLAAAIALPVVAATGILVRNTSDKFTTLSMDPSALPQRSEIFDRLGNPITSVYGVDLGKGMSFTGIDRQPVTYNQISPYMVQAITAIEDDRYWTHGALDVKGTLRALVNDLRHQPVQGGSTIAQQYVKGILVLQAYGNKAAEQAAIADNLSRKVDELRMAVQAEHNLSKQDILAGYLNDAFFGNGAWGIEAAAETYFSTTAAKLTLLQAATLAGIVENPTAYDPIHNPATALERRNTVLARIAATHPVAPAPTAPRLTADAAAAAMKQKLALHVGNVQSGCSANTVGDDAFFCDYVEHVVLLDTQFGATTQDRAKLLATGGLRIYTTLAPQDQGAATNAVNHVLPARSGTYNPAQNADTEVLIQPGTGKVTAIAEDRPYGTGNGQTEVDYAVNSQYGGQDGVQTGSSSKLFTLITALDQGVPFGFQLTVKGQEDVPGFTNCAGQPVGVDPQTGQVGVFPVVNAEGPNGGGAYSLYTGTTQSINVFYAHLEAQVGLCNVVHTAVSMGMTRADGTSLLAWDGAYKDKQREDPVLSAAGRRPADLHARRRQRVADVHGRGVRDAGRRRRLLQADRAHQGHQRRGPVAAGAVSGLPPGDVNRRGRRGELHPPGRPHQRHSRWHGAGQLPGRRQDGHLERGERERHAVRRVRGVHDEPGRLRLGVQPDLAGQVHDDRLQRLLRQRTRLGRP